MLTLLDRESVEEEIRELKNIPMAFVLGSIFLKFANMDEVYARNRFHSNVSAPGSLFSISLSWRSDLDYNKAEAKLILWGGHIREGELNPFASESVTLLAGAADGGTWMIGKGQERKFRILASVSDFNFPETDGRWLMNVFLPYFSSMATELHLDVSEYASFWE